MDRQRIWITLVGGFLLLIAGGSIAWAVVHPSDVNPADFTPGQAIDNSYFPLPVGTLFVYIGTKEGVPTYDEICVTPRTKLIEGVQITVVHHRSFAGSSLDLVEDRSEEHTSELQSRLHLVCRLLLEKKKTRTTILEARAHAAK